MEHFQKRREQSVAVKVQCRHLTVVDVMMLGEMGDEGV